jgi:tetratricopeptide (TPR) repeat protein
MVRIVKGSEDNLLSYFQRRHLELPRSVLFFTPADCAASWDATRGFLRQLAERHGEGWVARILSLHLPAASIISPGLSEQLAESVLRQREIFMPSIVSHLSHNWMIQRALFEAWARVVMHFVKESESEVLIPSPGLLDEQSYGVLRAMFRLFPEDLPDMEVGYAPERKEAEPDQNGIAWNFSMKDDRLFLFGLQALSRAEALDVAGPSGFDVIRFERARPESFALFGTDYEYRTLNLLRETPGSCPLSLSEALDILWSSFGGYGFASALQLGLACLRHYPDLSADQAADIHSIISLSAHNLMFKSQDSRLVQFLESHLRGALALEERPERRCALLYRLTVTLGRRKKDFRSALAASDNGLAEVKAGNLSVLGSRYQEAWVRNIRAYLFASLSEKNRSIAEAETACDILAGLDTQASERWALEIKMTRAILSSNLCALARRAGDMASLEKWSRLEASIADQLPGMTRFVAINWIDFYRRALRLDLALASAGPGITSAKAERDSYREYTLCVEAADLSYRLGRPAEALLSLEEARRLREVFVAGRDFPPLDLQEVSIALRLGLTERAAPLLERAMQTNQGSPDAMAEVWSLYALLAALEGDQPSADERLNQAIELAVASGERNTLLRTAITAGQVCKLLGREAEAAEAYERALEIATSEIEGSRPPAADHLRALLGAQSCFGRSWELTSACLELLRPALDDWDTWWELESLIDAVEDAVARMPEALATDNSVEQMRLLVHVARQRVDCEARAASLEQFLSPAPSDVEWAI